jgi:hypothetical protein
MWPFSKTPKQPKKGKKGKTAHIYISTGEGEIRIDRISTDSKGSQINIAGGNIYITYEHED